MRIRHRRTIALLMVMAATTTGATCEPGTIRETLSITYRQVGACNGYQQTEGGAPQQTVSAGPGAAFVVFAVNDIDNTTSVDFSFNPELMANDDDHVDMGLSLYQDLGVFTAVPTVVPKGTKQGIDGFVVIAMKTGNAPDPATEANQINYLLTYSTPQTEPGVFLTKIPSDRTSWPNTPNCRSIVFSARG